MCLYCWPNSAGDSDDISKSKALLKVQLNYFLCSQSVKNIEMEEFWNLPNLAKRGFIERKSLISTLSVLSARSEVRWFNQGRYRAAGLFLLWSYYGKRLVMDAAALPWTLFHFPGLRYLIAQLGDVLGWRGSKDISYCTLFTPPALFWKNYGFEEWLWEPHWSARCTRPSLKAAPAKSDIFIDLVCNSTAIFLLIIHHDLSTIILFKMSDTWSFPRVVENH